MSIKQIVATRIKEYKSQSDTLESMQDKFDLAGQAVEYFRGAADVLKALGDAATPQDGELVKLASDSIQNDMNKIEGDFKLAEALGETE